ncbi:uncharacterized protein LOC143906761 isoform X1 [Temnothorax americanus]|uniref:uncharacterized protein LOC143906761 isoform X1 n=1 Tax=Temnothorax americanus TaxID=1964332 RepID=UPI004069144F
MVYKCCVPKCTSNKQIPLHVFPKDEQRRRSWLIAIQRIDLIDAPKQRLDKLRICTLHFSDDLICDYTKRRILKEIAVPNINIAAIDTDINVPEIHEQPCCNYEENPNVQIAKNVGCESNLIPILEETEEIQEEEISNTIKETREIQGEKRNYSAMKSFENIMKKKLRKTQKQLYKKRKYIQLQRKKMKELCNKNKWEDLMKDVTSTQKIFMEIILKNLHCKPEGGQTEEKEYITGNTKKNSSYIITYNINICDMTVQGQRYNAKHKAFALTLYKTMGKHAYTSLRTIFKQIPSIQTLQSVLHKIPLIPGLNPFILRHLKSLAPKMSKKEKVCCNEPRKISRPHVNDTTYILLATLILL